MISLRSMSSASFRTGARSCFARSLALGVVLLLGLATAAPAQEMTATRKLGRGLAGMTMGIL